VAYKGDVSDARETPAIPIINSLKEEGAQIAVYDPRVTNFPLEIEKDLKRAISGADGLVIVTDHSEFRRLDFGELRKLMNDRPVLIDGRNVVTEADGFVFRGIGR